jgi:hypothetical protein
LKLRGFDAEQTGDEIWWNEWYEDADEACADCNGARLNRVALAVRFRGRSIAELAQLAVGDGTSSPTSICTGAKPTSRAISSAKFRRGSPFSATWVSPTLHSTARRRHSPEAKRSAFAWLPSSDRICAASATFSTSRRSASTPAITAGC